MRINGRRGALWQVAAATLLLGGAAASGSVTASAPPDSAGEFSSEPDVGSNPSGSESVSGSWTVLQYSMGDTNLEPFMMADVNEMGEVGSNENLNIVAMIDRSPDYGEDPVLDIGDWVGAKVLHIQAGYADELADLGPTDMGDPATLSSFISEGISAFPADHYALIISDHGAAWPGVGPDESADSSVLDVADLQSALESGLVNAGIDRLDLLGFDACLMAAYEVASALAPYADRLVASSETEPGTGWDYTSLQLLADNPETTADELGTTIVDTFIAGNTADTTLALLDLTQMTSLDEAMAAFTSALTERTATLAPDVGRTLADNPGYGRSPDPTQDFYMTDLGNLVGAIGIEALDVSDQADGVLQAMNDVVLYKGSGAQAPSFSGLSIYFPPSADLFDQAYVYAAPNPSGWVEFLDAYYSAGQGIAETDLPAFIDAEPTITGDATGLTVQGTVDVNSIENLSSATVSFGVQLDDGSTSYFSDQPATIADDGSGLVSTFYDLTVLYLSDGVDTATAYTSLSTDEENDGYGLEIPMAYYPPGWVEGDPYDDVVLSVAVDGEGNIIDETYFALDAETGATGELLADPTGIVVPQVLIVDADGNSSYSPTSDVGLYADLPNITYDFEPLETGTPIVVTMDVTDYGAHTSAISTVAEVP